MTPREIPKDDLQNRIRHDALSAADDALALWIVRIPFGILAIAMIWLGLDDSFHGHPERLGVLPAAFEPAHIAIRGRSFSLRYLLAGNGRRDGDIARDERAPVDRS